MYVAPVKQAITWPQRPDMTEACTACECFSRAVLDNAPQAQSWSPVK